MTIAHKKKTQPKKFRIEVPAQIDLSDTDEYLSVNQGDLNLYFAETYLKVGFPEKQTPQWAYCRCFSAEGPSETKKERIHVQLMFEGSKIEEVRVSDLGFDFSFPPTGLYNYRNGIVLFLRRNFRQNKKGLHQETGQFITAPNLYARFTEFPTGFALRNVWRWTPSNLNQVFMKSDYMEFSDAYAKICGLKSLAKALSLNFFIGQGLVSKEPAIWFRKTPIGVAKGENEIEIHNPLFVQEAIDFFQPRGIVVNAKA